MLRVLKGSLPWDDPNSDPIEDMKSLARYWYNRPYYGGPAVSDSIAIVSGGLDSTVLVYHMVSKGYEPHMLSFNYGQRHKKELTFASATALKLGLRHDIVDLSGLTHLISNSALTSRTGLTVRGMNFDGAGFHSNIEVPDGHYAEDSMKVTVVPNRNMIMLSIAGGIAVNNGYRTIATGVHGGDHFIYPDCRPEFIYAAAKAIWVGNEGFHKLKQSSKDPASQGIWAPFLNSTKADIAYRALELGVPLHMTWSCYKGGEKHCGKCGTCVERLEAIDIAMMRFKPEGDWQDFQDQTEYEDKDYWKTVGVTGKDKP